MSITINVCLHDIKQEKFATQIAGFDLPYYPSYHIGEDLFYQKSIKGDPLGGQKLTQYKIVKVHHSVRQLEKTEVGHRYPITSTILSCHVYLEEVED